MTSILVTSSASRNLLYWNEPIGWPKALRSLTYSRVSSRICAAWAMLPIALESRSCGSQFIMWMKPWLSSPIRFASGTRTLSKNSSAVSDSSWPTLSSLRPRVKPSMPASTPNSEMPRPRLASGSVRAATTTRSAE